ncbi:MAG TPA: hypothetical protein VNT26_05425 [Candidatus Sulfotelmatobacter sp.]|nr:hypothetical protein [Candidatus Sulfotelmatobacter sp.]
MAGYQGKNNQRYGIHQVPDEKYPSDALQKLFTFTPVVGDVPEQQHIIYNT